MKRITTLLPLVLLAFSLRAQIVIDASDVDPLNFSGYQSNDTLLAAGIQAGGNGLQTWDFSSLQNDYTDTLNFTVPEATPFAAEFPDATVAAVLNDSVFIYFKKNNTSLEVLGSHGSVQYSGILVEASIYYTPPQITLHFPASFNDTYSQSLRSVIQVTGAAVNFPDYDSVRLVTNIERDVQFNAYGNVTTPFGTFESLRSTETEVIIDSFYVYSSGFWFPALGSDPRTVTYYNWWTNQNGLGFPVVQIQEDDNGDREASWLNGFVSDAGETKPALAVTVTPNPASDFLSVKLPADWHGSAEVYDLNGRLAFTQPLHGGTESFSLNGLTNGSYLIIFKNKQGKTEGFQRFEVLK